MPQPLLGSSCTVLPFRRTKLGRVRQGNGLQLFACDHALLDHKEEAEPSLVAQDFAGDFR